jgi:OOP family OmpA-OmpF porin
MQYLISHGIEAKRLTASGFGPRVPIGDNNTKEGRQKNRRTEFHIKQMDAGGTAPQQAPPPK